MSQCLVVYVLWSIMLWRAMARCVMICLVMTCCVVVISCCIMTWHVMLHYVLSCCAVLCSVVLWYGQSAQSFYMCLESLVGFVEENFGSFTYFRLTERFYEVSLCTCGPTVFLKNIEAGWRILEQFWSNFDATVKHLFEVMFEALLMYFWKDGTVVKQCWSKFASHA